MRKKRVLKKKFSLVLESRFGSVLVSKLINKVMRDGKKNLASNIVYKTADIVESNTSSKFPEFLEVAVKNIQPELELKSYKRGASNQRIPVQINKERAESISLRWIVLSSRDRKSSPNSKRSIYENLAHEIMDAYKKTGASYKKKENLLKEVSSNMIYSKIRK